MNAEGNSEHTIIALTKSLRLVGKPLIHKAVFVNFFP